MKVKALSLISLIFLFFLAFTGLVLADIVTETIEGPGTAELGIYVTGNELFSADSIAYTPYPPQLDGPDCDLFLFDSSGHLVAGGLDDFGSTAGSWAPYLTPTVLSADYYSLWTALYPLMPADAAGDIVYWPYNLIIDPFTGQLVTPNLTPYVPGGSFNGTWTIGSGGNFSPDVTTLTLDIEGAYLVPEPSSFLLLFSGLIGFVAFRKKLKV